MRLLTLITLAAAVLGATPLPAAENATPGATFAVWEIRVLGNTVLAQRDIERVVYPHLGRARNLSDMDAARQELETAYREAGFPTVYVDIPEQNVVDGIVRLRVTEGRIGRSRIDGARYFSAREIREALPASQPDTVPHLSLIHI